MTYPISENKQVAQVWQNVPIGQGSELTTNWTRVGKRYLVALGWHIIPGGPWMAKDIWCSTLCLGFLGDP